MAAPKSSYATSRVPISKSQEEIRSLLTKFGARSFTMGEGLDPDGRQWAGVEFVHDDTLVRIRAFCQPYSDAAAKALRAATHSSRLGPAEWPEQEAGRVWRVLVWTIKARLVAVDEGLETFAQAFLAHLVDPANGRTLYDAVRPQIEAGALHMGGAGLGELGRGNQ